jgi:predicted deacetylase
MTMDPTRPQTLVSIHDVAPATLPAVNEIVNLLYQHARAPITLLVIPGVAWNDRDVAALQDLKASGCELAGHGWAHRCTPPRTLRHRLHSRLISRGVGEHISHDPAGGLERIADCHAWFAEHGFDPPDLYVPPAWTLGTLVRRDLQTVPFQAVELLTGVYTIQTRTFQRLPLLGYEADTPLRAAFLRAFNQWNWKRAIAQRLPLRLAIHPSDLDLLLAPRLRAVLARLGPGLSYRDLLGGTRRRP